MKHIVIDARLYGPTHTGIGRYVQNLLQELTCLSEFPHYRFTLLVYPELANQIKLDLGDNFQYFTTNLRHYSLTEQLLLPFTVYRLHPDLFHVPHFNKPILYFGRTVITIHDLIKHFSKGRDTTTKNTLLYWPKYWLYLLFTSLNIHHNHLIVPTNFWRRYLIAHFSVAPSKIITTYEAVDPLFLKSHPSTIYNLRSNSYLVYSGNLYPHKNIQVVFAALKSLPRLHLKIISKPNVFLDRAKKLAQDMGIANRIEFLGFVSDRNFHQLFSHSLAYVFPSLMEGFGLPGLEAQALSCPVISSRASCLPEVYGDSVLYFDPTDADELIGQIKKLQNDPRLRQDLINRGLAQVKKYSWQKTAQQTFGFYEKIIRS